MLVSNLLQVLFRAKPLYLTTLLKFVIAGRKIQRRLIGELGDLSVLTFDGIFTKVVGFGLLVARPLGYVRIRLVNIVALDVWLKF
jgi:hypothetical protein